ncbi:hypothetical protein GCM10022252_11200 [Streptosporangium oxazolinicum]|uniref:Uncharacterized protein n=1 Tax=Streptosporangium oxazolinicum TaxID=909287 RepID=A0ABP8AGI2_9ACTN
MEAAMVTGIVQAEGGRDPGHPKIARMIYDRLGPRTRLRPDTAVPYTRGLDTPEVSEKGAEVRSPRDTFFTPGLPPKTIANPGEQVLITALQPDQGDWFWFVTTNPEHRITKFTDKESEFVRYREELNIHLGKR